MKYQQLFNDWIEPIAYFETQILVNDFFKWKIFIAQWSSHNMYTF